ncbi:MAG TPA: serine/threonine-protein kinase [Labilithrix sp.]|nr:serine/threonine-protein kinase [Labilithrix sp.]
MVAASAEQVEATHDAIPVGPFVVEGLIGEGGSGKVYAVRREGCALALKVLRSDLALSARERRRFLDEAARMRRLSHPSIVPLVDAGALDDGRPYIAMPLLAGETLASRLGRGPLDLATALRYFTDIASAVSTIHHEGLLHRDIKPENVLLCRADEEEPERPVLLDLGIARDVDEAPSTTTERGNVRGTRAYMAPERFFGVAASSATDVYELGVLLYMMLVGKAPWAFGAGASTRLHPRDPAELGVTLPEALTIVVLRALSTRPEVRPSSVDAFSRSVHEAARQEASAAAIPDVEEPLRPRRPRALVVAVALGLALAGITAVIAIRRDAQGPGLPAAGEKAGGDVGAPAASAEGAIAIAPSVAAPLAPAASAAPTTSPVVRVSSPASRKVHPPPSSPLPSANVVEPAVSAPTSPSAAPTSTDRLYEDRK